MIKNGKIFGKINIFDFIVLVLFILLVAGGGIFLGLKSIKASQGENFLREIQYKLTIESVRQETIDSFEPGQPVYTASTKKQIGVITSIETKDSTLVMETLDGNVVTAPVEDKYNLTLTVRSIAKQDVKGDLWLTSNDRLLEGQSLTFLTQKNKCQGAVKNIETTAEHGALTVKFDSARESYYERNEN